MSLEEVLAVVVKGPFRGARVVVADAGRLVARVRFVTLPTNPLLVLSANLALGAERCVASHSAVGRQ
jgi:hypothetical protein